MVNPFKVKRDVYLFIRTPADISEEAVKRGFPSNTWGLSWFNGPMDIIMLPPPPDVPPVNRGWKWAMFLRDAAAFGVKFAHEYKHLKDGHFHDV